MFFNDFSPTIFHSKLHVERTLTEKDTAMELVSIFTGQTLECPTLHIFQINPFQNLKRNRLLDKKSCEPFDTTISCMDQWL